MAGSGSIVSEAKKKKKGTFWFNIKLDTAEEKISVLLEGITMETIQI